MRCPYCGYRESKVVDSRPADEGASIRRRRECLSCEKRFTTYETVEYLPMVVIKKDGSRQSFDRSKVLRGIQRSCEKRPVSAADMERMASEIEQELQNSLEREVSTVVIGEKVMEKLKKADEVAYVRFASVYQQFADVESFFNPNVVKVVLDDRGTALTFSRAPIPWPRDHFRETKESLPEGFAPLHHLGLYAYRAGFLRRFPTLPQAPLEKLESLEQLRALYYGERIAVMVLDAALPAGVDTQKDLDRVRAIFEKSAPV